MSTRKDPDKELENEADYFASVLLVPPAWLKADVARGLSPDVLVDRYDVSRDVMFIALKEYWLPGQDSNLQPSG